MNNTFGWQLLLILRKISVSWDIVRLMDRKTIRTCSISVVFPIVGLWSAILPPIVLQNSWTPHMYERIICKGEQTRACW